MLRRLLLLNFTLVHRVDRWFKRRFTPAGLLVLAGFATGAVFGIDLRETSSYQLFTLAGALLVVATVSALSFRPRLSVRRRLPRYATVGEPLVYTIEITNHGRRTQHGLVLREDLVSKPPSLDEFVRSAEPKRGRRNFFDRYVGYPRWSWLVRRKLGAVAEDVAVPPVAAGETLAMSIGLTPLRRGHLRLGRLYIARPDPFGLFKALARSGEPGSVLVLPRRYPARWSEPQGAGPLEFGGARSAQSGGDSEEFATVREYRPGDPLRHIHWRSWARLGQPIVKEFERQGYVRQALVLDTFSGRSGEDRFEEAVSVAASFVVAEPGGERRLDLVFVEEEVFSISAGKGIASLDRLLEALACVDRTEGRRFAALADRVLAEPQGLSACVCILLEWDSARRSFIESLRARGVPVLVLLVLDTPESASVDLGPMSDQPERLAVLPAGRAREALATLGLKSGPRVAREGADPR